MQQWTAQEWPVAATWILRGALGALMAWILPACGGGGGGPSPAPAPDLVALDLDFTPSSAGAGEPIQVVDLVRNEGDAAAQSFRVGFYLSVDAEVDDADLLLGERLVAELGPGESSVGDQNLHVPAGVGDGSWFLGVIVDSRDRVAERDETNNGMIAMGSLLVAGQSLPDLFVSSLDFSPSGAAAGEQIHVIDVVQNAGTETALGFQTAIYISADALVTGSDTLIGVRSIGALAADQHSTGGGFLTVPTELADGTWFLGAVTDSQGTVIESDETNNTTVAVQQLEITTAPLPDLVPTQVEFTPNVIEAGEAIDVTDLVENPGVGEAGSFQVGIYLSSDPMITLGDTLVGLRNVPELQSGGLSLLNAPVTVPATTSAGLWYVGSLVDVGGAQAETNEYNNTLVATGELQVIQPPRPDLVMTQLEFAPAQVDAGQSITIQETVLNQGLVDSGSFRVGIYLSTDDQITSADALIGFRSLAGLTIGQDSSVAAPVVVPSDVGGGVFHVGAIADHEEAVLEENEENNDLIALGTLEVHVPPMPDVLPVAISFSPSVVGDGDTIHVVERIVNQGTIDAASFRVGVYLSSDPSVSTSDVLLGWRTISVLAVGSANEAQSAYSLPAGIGSGSWTVGVIADHLDVLPEPNEGNNLLIAAGHVDVTTTTDPKPDLVVETLSFSPNLVLEGGTLTVQSLVRNEGDVTAAQFITYFYLSEDDVIEPTDHYVGERTIFNLGVGQASAQSAPYTLDVSLPLGLYHFGAICDATGLVDESNEANNAKLAVGTVEIYRPPPPAPELQFTNLSFDPASLPAGDDLQIDDTVKNCGNLAAEALHVDFFLSDDEVITTDDLLLGTRNVPGLDPAAESVASTQVSVPTSVAVGTWYVGAIVTIDVGTGDSNEANNSHAATETLEVTQ